MSNFKRSGHATLTRSGKGAATHLMTSDRSTPVDVESAAPPTAGQRLTATGAEAATWQDVAASGDADAIHDNVAGEIAAVANKATAIAGDHILIEDSANSNNKKRMLVSGLRITESQITDLVHTTAAPTKLSLRAIYGGVTANSNFTMEFGVDSSYETTMVCMPAVGRLSEICAFITDSGSGMEDVTAGTLGLWVEISTDDGATWNDLWGTEAAGVAELNTTDTTVKVDTSASGKTFAAGDLLRMKWTTSAAFAATATVAIHGHLVALLS